MDMADLAAIEAIKFLRGRFARSMDTKDWASLGDCIAEDCLFDCTQEAGVDEPWRGREEIVANIRRSFASAITVHQAHTPEITVLGPDRARGIWAMQDLLRFPGVPVVELVGYGHYHEDYRRDADGRWRIAGYRLTRLRSDVARRFPEGQEPPPPPARARDAAHAIRAMRAHGYGGPEVLRLDTVAAPLPGPGEVRLRVAAAAVNPIDLKLRAGVFELFMPLAFPAQIGGDLAGVVDAVGTDVAGLQVGDRVMGMINPMADGAYAEAVVVPAALVVKVPDGLDLATAAALPMAVLTGYQLVEQGLDPRAGDRVLVTGAAGAVGRVAVHAAHARSARVVAAVRAGREGAVADLPIEAVVDIADGAAVAALGPFDGIADTVGGLAVERLARAVKPGGTLASVVSPPPALDADVPVRIAPVWVSFDAARLSAYAEEVAAGRIRAPIAARFPLEEAAAAHRRLERGGVDGKVLLEME